MLVFDEVVSGFRSHPRGAQGIFGIQADIASYGKVVGGGFPIGVIAGKRRFMDALDGGHWEYGDDSIPDGRRDLLRRHLRPPPARPGGRQCASLKHCATAGPLQERLTARTAAMIGHISAFIGEIGAPFKLATFASLWRNIVHRGPALRRPRLRDAARPRRPHPRQLPVLPHHGAHNDEDIATIVRGVQARPPPRCRRRGLLPRARSVGPVACAGRRRRGRRSDARPRGAVDRAAARDLAGRPRSAPAARSPTTSRSSLHLRGELDIGALRHAVRELPARHDALRATLRRPTAWSCAPAEALDRSTCRCSTSRR